MSILNICNFFIDNKYSTIAIYGVGKEGRKLIDELASSEVSIKYGIDRNATNIECENFPIYTPDSINDKEQVDCIVVTPINDFVAIEEQLEKLFDCDIVSLETVRQYYLLRH
jgi:hypothetical protein